MTRLQRQSQIKDLLTRTLAMTQETIVVELQQIGIQVTQSTVSRDLAAIGAVRGPHGYALPGPGVGMPISDLNSLLSLIRDHVIWITPAASIVVLHTAPGHANFVASEIDAVRPSEMVGCLAGDDTIFVATPSIESARSLAKTLKSALEANG